MSRTTVTQRLEPLLTARLLVPTAEEARTGGRPADRFVLNRDRGVILVADMGATGIRAAICDMTGTVLDARTEPSDVTRGPIPILDRAGELFTELLTARSGTPGQVRGIGIDVPGPVDHRTGRVVSPPIMTGWHDFDIPGHFRPHYACPVVVEKDVNAMAFGEQRLAHPDTPDLVFIKVGTGIGTGLITAGRIYRGADGAAGDIGHIPLASAETDPPVCRCGNLGCVEAYASGWAIQRDLRALGLDVPTVTDVVRLTRAGNPDAIRLFRQSAALLGAAVSDVVNLLNPRTVVLGGQLAALDEVLFASVREVVYRRSLPLATRNLQVLPSRLGDNVGVHGLALLVTDHIYAPANLPELLRFPT